MCPKCVAAITGTFAADVPEGACTADYYLNLGGGAVSVGSSSGSWAGGVRHGCGCTSVTVQRAPAGGGEEGLVNSTTVHQGV
jgi:hypothetical protein